MLAAAVPIVLLLNRTPQRFAGEAITTTTTTIHPDDGGETLSLMSEAGEAMIDSGYDVVSVQAAMDDIGRANGLPRAESIALPTAILVSARIRGQVRTAAVATGSQELRLHQVEELDDVITYARRGLIAPREALARIAAIRTLPPPYTTPVQLLGHVLTSAGLAVLLGGSWIGIAVAAVLGAFVGGLLLLGARLPSRYQVLLTVVAAFVVALAVLLLSRTSLELALLPILMAPLVLLLPGALLTTSVIELATGQMVSGAGRLAAGAMQLLLLALGITAAAALVGVPAIDLTRSQTPLGPLGPWIAVAVFGAGVVLNRCARARSLGWILLVLYVAYGAQVVGNLLLGGVLSAFVGAAAMTPVAAIVARQRTGPPAMVSFTPAFWLLVPGALGLVGVTTILDGDVNGIQTLLTTTSTMVAIALGVLVGWAMVGVLRRLRDARHDRQRPVGGGSELS
ncbi:MAG TPA: threonine/serine exporter family protein [Microlunatus sp.]|nr:threonine/serine exporter family protein [Microlunatus sp.]